MTARVAIRYFTNRPDHTRLDITASTLSALRGSGGGCRRLHLDVALDTLVWRVHFVFLRWWWHWPSPRPWPTPASPRCGAIADKLTSQDGANAPGKRARVHAATKGAHTGNCRVESNYDAGWTQKPRRSQRRRRSACKRTKQHRRASDAAPSRHRLHAEATPTPRAATAVSTQASEARPACKCRSIQPTPAARRGHANANGDGRRSSLSWRGEMYR